MELQADQTDMRTTMDVAPATPAPARNPAHQGMVDYLADVMRHYQLMGHTASEVIMRLNRQEAQLAAAPAAKKLEQHVCYANMIGANTQEATDTVLACAEPTKAKHYFAELHCDALDKLLNLEQRDNRHADREHHVIRAAALAHYAAEHYHSHNQYLTQYGIDTILQTQQLSEHEMSAARALFLLFQREKPAAIDRKDYRALAIDRSKIAAHAAGD
jgi:hypothetical protein